MNRHSFLYTLTMLRTKIIKTKQDTAKSSAVSCLSSGPQYSESTVGPLSNVTCSPMFMQFTGCHQPVQGFYWPENAIDWLRKC